MAIRPRNLGRKFGLPHENPATPEQASQNDRNLQKYIAEMDRAFKGRFPLDAAVAFSGPLAADPPDPLPGAAMIYLLDDGLGVTEIRAKYTQADGTVLAGTVATLA